jgi:hypothetical protein
MCSTHINGGIPSVFKIDALLLFFKIFMEVISLSNLFLLYLGMLLIGSYYNAELEGEKFFRF